MKNFKKFYLENSESCINNLKCHKFWRLYNRTKYFFSIKVLVKNKQNLRKLNIIFFYLEFQHPQRKNQNWKIEFISRLQLCKTY